MEKRSGKLVDEVLACLSTSDDYISGAELGKTLHVTRNAIWKAIKQLQNDGYEIEAVTNRGYRMADRPGAFNTVAFRRALKSKGLQVEVFDEVNSTNLILKNRAEEGAPEGTVVLAASQTAGRGRLGRKFYSPKGSGIYVSILLRCGMPVASAQLITTCAAVAVARAIREVVGVETGIKWVNDIYYQDKKVCGILTEASVDFETGNLRYAVLGIGIDLEEPAEGYPEDIAHVAGSLGKGISRIQIAAAVVDQFMAEYPHLLEKRYLDEYRSRSILTDCPVTVISGDTEYPATVVGIDGNFGLVVRLENGEERTLTAGEVSIRRKG